MSVTDVVIHSGTAPDTTLAADITSGSNTITLTSGTGYPSPTGGQIALITLAKGTSAEEVVSYTGRSGTSLTGCTRGLGGTSPAEHKAGISVYHGWTATEADDAMKAVLNTLGRITAIADLLYADSTTTLARLAKGAAYQALGMNAADNAPAWMASLQSLMTAAGDIVYASSANTPARLAKGTDGQVLTLASGAPSWAAATLAGTSAIVATQESTTSTSYTDLSTPGPAVTWTPGASGLALIIIAGDIDTGGVVGEQARMSFVLSGGNTLAVADTRRLAVGKGGQMRGSYTYLATGLAAVSTTATAKYRSSAGNSCTFTDRAITVVSL